MPSKYLEEGLNAVDWQQNVADFLAAPNAKDEISKANLRIAIWAKQFEKIDRGNPALCFVREMQLAGHHVAAASAVSLYKCAASSIRNIVETALYYSYFRCHPKELETLVRDSKFYLSKEDILEYHKKHTANFSKFQEKLNFIGKLTPWYSNVSAIVHGQIPGTWIEHKSLSEISHKTTTLDLVVKTFCDGEEIVHLLFLCTKGHELWDYFSTSAKQKLMHGLPGDIKTTLGLDAA